MSDHEQEPEEPLPEPDAPDPSGAHASTPGRTGEHPQGDRPGDETVPPE